MKNVFDEILFKIIEDDRMESTSEEGWRAYYLKYIT